MSQIKLTKTEIKTLQDLQSTSEQICAQLGRVILEKAALERQKEHLQTQHNNLQESVQTTLNQLSEKYGNGRIDLSKGVIFVEGSLEDPSSEPVNVHEKAGPSPEELT